MKPRVLEKIAHETALSVDTERSSTKQSLVSPSPFNHPTGTLNHLLC
jgi:hypothetical protein